MLITNFSAGELSKKLSGRIDLQQYFSGCSHLKNFEIIPTGGIERRKGFERIGELSGNARIIPFIINKDENFILEVTPGVTYFWKNGIKFTQESISNPYENMDQIREIQFAQDYDTLILVQKDHAPIELKYSWTNNTFAANEMEFDFYPDVQLDDDFDFIMYGEELPVYEEGLSREGSYVFSWYYYSGDDRVNKSNTFTSLDLVLTVYNGQLYQYDEEVPLKWRLYQEDPDVDTTLFTTETKYPSCVAFFNSRLWFASTTQHAQKIWASAAPDTKGQRYNDFSTWQKFITVNKIVKDADMHIFTADIDKDNIDKESNTTLLTNVTQNLTSGLEKELTAYYITNSTYVPVGTKIKAATWDSVKQRGTVLIDAALNIPWEEKEEVKYAIVFSAGLWRYSNMASADDYEYQIVSNNAVTSDCSFSFEIASDQNDAIKWIGSSKYLVIGSESSVWVIPSSVTALNIMAEMNGRYGSDNIQGLCVDRAMIFFAQGKCGIREYYYDSSKEAFMTNNIAILAEQMLTESPAVDFDFITNPYNRLIITREDGIVVSLLYDKNNGVMGWNRISHASGKIVSCAVTRGDMQSDIVFYVVKEGDGPEARYFLERYDGNKEVYLDSWKLYKADMDLSEYGENIVFYNETTGEECSQEDIAEGDIVYVGRHFESVISSMPIIANDPTGKKRITNLLVRFLESYMPVMKIDGLSDEKFNGVEEPYSGIRNITYPGISDRDVTFTLAIDKAKACNILAVNAALS
ncbi:MAG: hypothetical protein MJ052_01450 [Sphaerochaetaceae bacterium]|nr:hypothetical protein [Sphaerochaetaceae bacterium]